MSEEGNKVTGRKTLVLVMIGWLLFGTASFSADWPQWRGARRDGIWREEGIVQRFDCNQLPIKWRREIAGGYSGPTVAGGRVYVMDRLRVPKQVERVHCFDAMTGKKIWTQAYDCIYKKVGYPVGPRASVTIDDNRAYSLGTMGHLYCFDAVKGNVIWSKDLNSEYKIKIPIWGIAASPIVEEGLVIVHIGGKDNACIVAFDKITGAEKWRALGDLASYSSPIVIDQAGKRVLVCWTDARVAGLNSLNGELYWEWPFKPSKMVIGVATPVLRNNYLFVSSFYDGSLLLKVRQDKLGVEKIWRRKGESERNTDSLHCMISTPVILGDYIYGVDSYGQLRCLELSTGDRIWESLDAVPTARWANIHLIQNGDNIWMFNELGELIISKLSPEGFDEISRARLIERTQGQLDQRGGVCWSHPAFAYKHVYIRNDKELLCANLSATD